MAVLLEELLVRVGVKASDGPGGQEGRNSFLFVERGWVCASSGLQNCPKSLLSGLAHRGLSSSGTVPIASLAQAGEQPWGTGGCCCAGVC